MASDAKDLAGQENHPLIEDYAMIGDCETAALVSRDGSIDWLCLPRFDSPACFAALLGTPENGCWRLSSKEPARTRRRYRPNTLTLETEFRTKTGTATLIDFMPLRESHPKICRSVRGDRGSVQFEMDLAIRFDFGLTVPWVFRGPQDALHAIAGPNRLILNSSVPVAGKGLRTQAEFTVLAGKSEQFELRYSESFHPIENRKSDLSRSMKSSEQSWQKWISQCTYKGPFEELLRRSLITLKALTYAPTAGMVAAPTTSLPEQRGGQWNWDYRYCWLRDATFALLGFLHAGFHEEARRWKDWLTRSVAGSADQLQIMYGVEGDRLLREWTVPWLRGYQGASPVRVGNAASEQLQIDVFGELGDVLFQSGDSSSRDGSDFDLQVSLLEHLRRIWREPDHGIWETRGRPRHFTYSKVMAWVAFDRAIRGAERSGTKAPLVEWRVVRDEIHQDVCRHGFNSRMGSFAQSYGSHQVDASLVLLPLLGFLPPLDPRIVGTVREIEKRLIRDGFVMRYRPAQHGHASRPHEGAFLPCSFWLADYYELAGRRRDAKRLLSRLVKIANDVGLLSEEYDASRRRLMGNFPQALTHVALVNTIINQHTRHGPVHQRSGREKGQPGKRS